MRNPEHSGETSRPAPQARELQARDLQAKLYREIGISAVAAALRFTTLPEPTGMDGTAAKPRSRDTLAA